MLYLQQRSLTLIRDLVSIPSQRSRRPQHAVDFLSQIHPDISFVLEEMDGDLAGENDEITAIRQSFWLRCIYF